VTRYELIIWSKEDDSFVIEVPELPGCMANGQTYAAFRRFNASTIQRFNLSRGEA
jgi:predicted RNase H-like HicB family nuclease